MSISNFAAISKEFSDAQYNEALTFLEENVASADCLIKLMQEKLYNMKRKKMKRSFIKSFNNLQYCVQMFREFYRLTGENLVHLSQLLEDNLQLWMQRNKDVICHENNTDSNTSDRRDANDLEASTNDKIPMPGSVNDLSHNSTLVLSDVETVNNRESVCSEASIYSQSTEKNLPLNQTEFLSSLDIVPKEESSNICDSDLKNDDNLSSGSDLIVIDDSCSDSDVEFKLERKKAMKFLMMDSTSSSDVDSLVSDIECDDNFGNDSDHIVTVPAKNVSKQNKTINRYTEIENSEWPKVVLSKLNSSRFLKKSPSPGRDDEVIRQSNQASINHKRPRSASISTNGSSHSPKRNNRQKSSSEESSSSLSLDSDDSKQTFNSSVITDYKSDSEWIPDFASSLSNTTVTSSSSDTSDDVKIRIKNRKKIKKELSDNESSDETDLDQKTIASWLNDPLLKRVVDGPVENENRQYNRETKESVPDPDIEIISDSSSPIGSPKRSKIRKHRPKVIAFDISSSEDDDVQFVAEISEGAKGRKSIRGVISDTALAETTKQANKLELERLDRLSQRNSSQQEIFSEPVEGSNKLILEFDTITQKPRVCVHPAVCAKLKPHQKAGIRFMWDSCFESLQLAQSTEGSGCVLAHCMGLGKTLQVISLIYTLFTYEQTNVKRVLIIVPKSTVPNWVNEFNSWLKDLESKFRIFTLQKCQTKHEKEHHVNKWFNNGGVMILNYAAFRVLSMNTEQQLGGTQKLGLFSEALINPGPNLLVCDEGHTLKNKKSIITRQIDNIKTKRRIMLTGTPLQNNLKEYYCMVNLVKPYLLGTEHEYTNRFVNPILNGQHKDSYPRDIQIMKQRSHVLHKLLKGVVQRYEGSLLRQYLPSLMHYILCIRLSDLQETLYKAYTRQVAESRKLIMDYHILKTIWTHPLSLDLATKRREMRDSTKNVPLKTPSVDLHWWEALCSSESLLNINMGLKIVIMFGILNQCRKCGDKVLAFSTSLNILTTVEFFLKQGRDNGILNDHWILNEDYSRIDGQSSTYTRQEIYKKFNDEKNTKLRLLLASTKVCGLGVNLIGANRIIILDTPWNPADDMQSVYRIFRFGQKKKCYVYSLVALGTMEHKIYERSVTKQALARRVVDEHQIDRHYISGTNVTEEFYNLVEYKQCDRPIPKVPKDRILASVLQTFPHIIWSYHEHDHLLRNQEDEELDETERAAAWADFQQDEARQNMLADIAKNPENRASLRNEAFHPSALVPNIPSTSGINQGFHNALQRFNGNDNVIAPRNLQLMPTIMPMSNFGREPTQKTYRRPLRPPANQPLSKNIN